MNLLKVVTCFMVLTIATTHACENTVCTGDIVYPLNYIMGHATVKGINNSTDEVVVQSSNNNLLDRQELSNLAISKGCFKGICVGDTVYPLNYISGYATVKGINKIHGVAMVLSSNNNLLDRQNLSNLTVADECANYTDEERNSH